MHYKNIPELFCVDCVDLQPIAHLNVYTPGLKKKNSFKIPKKLKGVFCDLLVIKICLEFAN